MIIEIMTVYRIVLESGVAVLKMMNVEFVVVMAFLMEDVTVKVMCSIVLEHVMVMQF